MRRSIFFCGSAALCLALGLFFSSPSGPALADHKPGHNPGGGGGGPPGGPEFGNEATTITVTQKAAGRNATVTVKQRKLFRNPRDGHVYAVLPRTSKSKGKFDGKLELHRSTDDGQTWSMVADVTLIVKLRDHVLLISDVYLSEDDASSLLRVHVGIHHRHVTEPRNARYLEARIHDDGTTEWLDSGNVILAADEPTGSLEHRNTKIVRLANGRFLTFSATSMDAGGGDSYWNISVRGSDGNEDTDNPTWGPHAFVYDVNDPNNFNVAASRR